MTKNCPICKGKTSDAAYLHVMKELEKCKADPSYQPKPWIRKDKKK